jgi:YD repeat-containing protein
MRDSERLLIAGAIAIAAVASLTANASETVNYTYDARGRLVKVERSGTVNNNAKAEYKYDKGDNRTNVNTVAPN